MPSELAARFLDRSCYYLGVEYPAKIRAAVHTMSPDQLWWRPHPGANSAGNLLLHLSGNVRQWIISGVGGAPDQRHRDAEFAAQDGGDAASLLAALDATCTDACAVIRALSAEELAASRAIQGRDTNVFSAIYHVVEHFAGHTGQIILLAKQFTPGAVHFYDDTGGLARPLFLPAGASDAS